jgi:hypothetical protein
MATAYRFCDRVAVHLNGKGETRYLTAKDARALARQINRCARSIKSETVSNSTSGTVTVPDYAVHNRED